MNNSKINILGQSFKNPIIAASGTFAFGREFEEFYDISKLGGISVKGLTINERQGNKGVRIYETKSGIMNSVGLQNPGVDKFLNYELPYLREKGMVVIANLAGHCDSDYIKIVERVSDSDVNLIELNISCPNVKAGGMSFGVKPESVFEIVKKVKKICKKNLIVKLTPNVESIGKNAIAAEDAGADAVSLVNTFEALAVDYKTRKPIFSNIKAGLSGPAIKPIALRMVYDCYQAVKIPIIGMGGIETFEDVLEFIICGASLVQIGSANLYDPLACKTIIENLDKYLNKNKINILELIGSIEV